MLNNAPSDLKILWQLDLAHKIGKSKNFIKSTVTIVLLLILHPISMIISLSYGIEKQFIREENKGILEINT